MESKLTFSYGKGISYKVKINEEHYLEADKTFECKTYTLDDQYHKVKSQFKIVTKRKIT